MKVKRKFQVLFLLFAFLVSFSFTPRFIAQDTRLTATEESDVLARADSILQQLRTLRGLPPPQPFREEFRSKAQLRQLLLKYTQEEKTQTILEAERKTMVAFGLIPPDFPYVQFTLELLTEQVAGFYDFRAHELNLLDATPASLQVPVLAHELTHALQDQSFNLKVFMEPAPNNDDLTETREALVEGDATAMMMDYLMKPLGRDLNTLGFDVRDLLKQTNQLTAGNSKIFKKAPRAIQTALTAPYLYGTSFFQYFRRRNDWARVSAIYRDPPRSMEQIMHPDKYFDRRDNPVSVTIPKPGTEFLKRWTPVDTNVLGELGMLIVLQQFLSDDNAQIASEGWGGDQYAIYEDGSGRLLVLLFSTWDTEEDALQFFNSYHVLLDQKYKNLKLVNAVERKSFRGNAGDRQAGLELRGHDVILIEGAPVADYEALQDLLWKSRHEVHNIPTAVITVPSPK